MTSTGLYLIGGTLPNYATSANPDIRSRQGTVAWFVLHAGSGAKKENVPCPMRAEAKKENVPS